MKNMKDYMTFSIFISPKRKLKNILIILIHIISILKIHSLYNFKAIYLSNNYYYIITPNNISYYYDQNDGENRFSIEFELYEQFIYYESEAEMISLGTFKNSSLPNSLIVKHYLYSINKDNTFCYSKLLDIIEYQSEIYPIKCREGFCYYILGIINLHNELKLFLYKKPENECPDDLSSINTYTISNVDSKNINCQALQKDENDFFICFYHNDNRIIVSHFNYSTYDNLIIVDNDKKKRKIR